MALRPRTTSKGTYCLSAQHHQHTNPGSFHVAMDDVVGKMFNTADKTDAHAIQIVSRDGIFYCYSTASLQHLPSNAEFRRLVEGCVPNAGWNAEAEVPTSTSNAPGFVSRPNAKHITKKDPGGRRNTVQWKLLAASTSSEWLAPLVKQPLKGLTSPSYDSDPLQLRATVAPLSRISLRPESHPGLHHHKPRQQLPPYHQHQDQQFQPMPPSHYPQPRLAQQEPYHSVRARELVHGHPGSIASLADPSSSTSFLNPLDPSNDNQLIYSRTSTGISVNLKELLRQISVLLQVSHRTSRNVLSTLPGA
ncbi:hypothetical protein DL93DRAFT_2186453 [Clavulina sp. PMI_390]|nr:hypothetical protein DL93DRAFT_2186453 [Clavulina sp. PMI_390]